MDALVMRVVRALLEAEQAKVMEGFRLLTFEELAPAFRDYYERMARAAIAAVRHQDSQDRAADTVGCPQANDRPQAAEGSDPPEEV